MLKLVTLFAMATLCALTSSTFAPNVNAQYVPLPGRIIGNTNTTIPSTGANATLTCQLLDIANVPLANQLCTFTILNEPGGPNGDAAVGSKTITKSTGPQGQVATTNLYVGSKSGVIVIGVTSGGLASTISLSIQPSGSPPPAIATTQSIRPPSTGEAGLASTSLLR